MNYLAHAYLSFKDPSILLGNMISDFVKGKTKFDYPPTVQNGIMLHRQIDHFTDTHQVTKKAMLVFKPLVGAYAGAFVDVVYDHFLANDTVEFPGTLLEEFAQNTYHSLRNRKGLMPEKFIAMLPYMISQNWLVNYRFARGIENSFGGIIQRAKYLERNDKIMTSFIENYELLQHCYNDFFPSLKAFALENFNLFQKE